MIEAIIGHLVADYLLQNDWMAANKKKSSLVCALHCAIWAGAVCTFGTLGFLSAIVLFVTHFAQDRTGVVAEYMDAMGQKGFRTGPCAPWSSIVVDNVLHIVTIYLVVKGLGGL